MGFARSFRRQMKRHKEVSAKKRRRKALLEPLEPRILLSSETLAFSAAAGAAIDIALRLDDPTQELQLIDNMNLSVLQSKALAVTGAVVITGGELSDKLTVDFNTPFSVPNGILFSDSLSGDSDLLKVTGKANVWNILGGNGGNVDGAGLLDFLGIENLIGGDDADMFVLEAGGSVDGVIDGGEGADSLEGADTTNTWEITALDAGALNSQIFESVENLIGGEDQDTFVLADAADVSGAIDGGGGAGSDTLVGPDADTIWNIQGLNAGNVAGINFSGFENLTGGIGADTFAFFDAAGISGVIDGGGGVNTLDYSNYSSDVNADLAAGTATGTGGISNIQNVSGGSGNDTLAGDEAANILVGGTGDDSLTGGAGADTLDGGEDVDTLKESRDADFTLTDTGLTIGAEGTDTISGVEQADLSGGAGDNILNASAFSGAVNLAGLAGDDIFLGALGLSTFDGGTGTDRLVGKDTANIWEILLMDAGLLNGQTFTSIEDLVGGAVADSFILAAGALVSGLIDGRQGSDRLTGGNTPNIWNITGKNAGKLNNKFFNDIENLTGGEEDDAFIFDGGSVDSVDGGAGEDNLRGPLTDSTWNITGTDSGDVEGIGFSNVENLTGAADNEDLFSLLAGGQITGGIEGGDGGFDSIKVDAGGQDAILSVFGPDSGSITIGALTTTYAGFEPVEVQAAPNIILEFADSDDPAVVLSYDLSTGGAKGTGGATDNFTLNSPTIESHTLMVDSATASVTIRLGTSADQITVDGVDGSHLSGILTIDGEGGDDTFILGARVATTPSFWAPITATSR
jgi:acrosin